MADAPQFFDPHLDLFRFTHPLPHLTWSINRGRRTKIVAIGSSSTAGEPTAPDWQVRIVPYPARLELALRREHFGCMIDACYPSAAGNRCLRDDPAERTERACDDDHFSVHLRHLRDISRKAQTTHTEMTCNGGGLRGVMDVQRQIAGQGWLIWLTRLAIRT